VTSRTFDVASYLRTRGSDSIAIQEIAATDFEEYREVNELILQGRKLGSDILIAQAKDSTTYDTVVISKAADAMLAMSGIEASFWQKIHKDLSLSRLEVVVKSMCNALWKSWVVEVTLI
jgi:c-di-AMP phosphodiesterase-like protein